MNKSDFVHLHLHTEFSLLDGACRIDRIFKRAKEVGQDAVAITDHGVMYGALAFYKAGIKNGIKPIIGCEVYVAPRNLSDKEHNIDKEYNHLVLLCKNMTGYQNLIRMVTLSFTDGFYQKPRVDMALLEKHHDGLIALSGCLAGKIPQLILAGKTDEAEKHALQMKSIFGKDSYYFELQDHGIADQIKVNGTLIAMSKKLGVGLCCTNDVHYLAREDARSHDILLCIQTGKTLQDADRLRFESEEFYFKSTEEIASLFARVPEAVTNTKIIADSCNLEFDLTNAHLPSFRNELGLSSAEYLEKLCSEGLERKVTQNGIQDIKAYRDRLNYELATIEKMGFCDYFLIVADFVGFAKKNGIYVGPGRGSGAGSLAAWCLDITELDPISYKLIFERFLNPERVSMPDFDIDFCYERRHEVIEYVSQKYGEDHVAQIVTFSTMAARAAVRDVGRVMGMSYAEVDRIVKRIPHFSDMTIERALQDDAELRELCAVGQNKELMDAAMILEGMPRNASIHAAGVVLTDRKVSDYVPLAVNSGMKVTQFTMNEIADLGLLKIDFLGLRYLTIIRDTVDLIHKSIPDFDIHQIPLDDADTYRMISDGKTAGMFQIESSGMKALMMQLKPQNIEDVTAAIALYRPGPKDSIPRFLENKNRGKIEYSIPSLADILDVTYGCIVYQEQVMEIFRKLAGYSFGRADIVRRAMSKKKMDVMAQEKDVFLHGKVLENGEIECEGALRRGVAEKDALVIFDEMADFAKYAFNKSHAAAYSILSYRTAYLKCKFTKEYMAAILTSQLDSGKYALYIAECQKLGIGILPPDVNESDFSFSVEKDSIRFGLVGIKNVGEGLIRDMFIERNRQPFTGFFDFTERMKPHGLNKKALESIILSGAMDSFGIYRSRLCALIDSALLSAGQALRSVLPGQMSIFDGAAAPQSVQMDSEFPDIPEFSKKDLLRLEKSVCGIYLSGHPLASFGELAEKVGAAEIASFSDDTESFSGGEKVRLLCLINQVTQKQIRTGEKMAFLQAEDLTGNCEIIVFPKVLAKYRDLIQPDAIVSVSGEINLKDEEVKIIAASVEKPEDAQESTHSQAKNITKNPNILGESVNFALVRKIYLRFPEKSSKIEKRVLGLLGIFPGAVPVFFFYTSSGKLFQAQGLGVSLGKTLYRELCEILGKDNVVFK